MPLRLRAEAVDVDVDFAAAISQDISMLSGDVDSACQQTHWDLLVGKFAADYHFAVVSTAEGGMVVPYIAGYRGKDGRGFEDILVGEYTHQESQLVMPRPFRGMGILSGIGTRSGADGFADDAPPDASMGMGGWYDAKKPGAVRIDRAPRWLSQIMAPERYSADSSGVFDGGGNALAPGVGKDNGARAEATARAVSKVKPALDAYAKCRYAQEVLKGRYAVVSGAARFDIAPGSTVLLEGARGRFIADDVLGESHFGQVLRVSVTLDAEAPACGTAFHIGFLRSERENGDDSASVQEHPFYSETFHGCRLVET